MPRLNLRRSLSSRSLLALVPVAALAAVFALGVPGEGSGVPCESDTECPDGEACGEGVCESVAGGCGGEQDSGIGVASTQAEGALKRNVCPANIDCSINIGFTCQQETQQVGWTTCTCEESSFSWFIEPQLNCAIRTFDPMKAQ